MSDVSYMVLFVYGGKWVCADIGVDERSMLNRLGLPLHKKRLRSKPRHLCSTLEHARHIQSLCDYPTEVVEVDLSGDDVLIKNFRDSPHLN